MKELSVTTGGHDANRIVGAMPTFTITVRALGYDSVEMKVPASDIYEARRHEPEAVNAWLKANDVDEDSLGLAFVETRRDK